jgi:hypothetical protein
MSLRPHGTTSPYKENDLSLILILEYLTNIFAGNIVSLNITRKIELILLLCTFIKIFRRFLLRKRNISIERSSEICTHIYARTFCQKLVPFIR